MVGLFFFIRASVKDRTQQIQFITDMGNESLLDDLKTYFLQRAYRVVKVDNPEKKVTFEGYVRPSVFLAVFLSFLTAAGFLCLSLVLSLLYPDIGLKFLSLIAFSPLAGGFYWQQAGRLERVLIQLDPSSLSAVVGRCYVTVTAHRDELHQLKQAFPSAMLNSPD